MLFWVTHIILFIILLTLLEGYSIVLLTYQIFYEQNIQDFLKHTAKDYHNQSVNPPIVRASTIIFKSMQDIRKMQDKAKNVLQEAILIMADKEHLQLIFFHKY